MGSNFASFFSVFKSQNSGRNNSGRITVRHRGGGDREQFIRTAAYGRYFFHYGSRCFRFAEFYFSGRQFTAWIRPNINKKGFIGGRFNIFCLPTSADLPRPLYKFKIGQNVKFLEARRGSGSVFGRAFGSKICILGRHGSFVTVRFPSGEIRRVSLISLCQPYDKSEAGFSPKMTKAGETRKLGIRPSVRGCAINPVDHPHGGRTGESRPSVSPWARLTKGCRTGRFGFGKKFVVFSVQDAKNRSAQSLLLTMLSRVFPFRFSFDFTGEEYFFYTRSCRLGEEFLGKRIFVYTGNRFKYFLFKEHHVGQPIGSFVHSKVTGKAIHIKGKKRVDK